MARKPKIHDDEPAKRKRGRPSQAKADADDDQEPSSNFRKVADTDNELTDPSLFKEMDQQRIPKLENRARAWLIQDDFAKKETEKAKALAEECQLIMSDHEIDHYRRGDIELHLESKVKLKGHLG